MIKVLIDGNELKQSEKNGGVCGEHNSTEMLLSFDGEWSGYNKKVVFYNALGFNPVTVLLNDAVGKVCDREEYLIKIPGEALEFEGEVEYVVEGRVVEETEADGEIVTTIASRKKSVDGRLKVRYSPSSESEEVPGTVSATVGEQLQAEAERLGKKVDEVTSLAVSSAPYIDGDTGTWFVYDAETKAHIDSGISAQGEKGETGAQGEKGEKGESGKPPKIGTDGNWYVWDNDLNDYVNTSVKALGINGIFWVNFLINGENVKCNETVKDIILAYSEEKVPIGINDEKLFYLQTFSPNYVLFACMSKDESGNTIIENIEYVENQGWIYYEEQFSNVMYVNVSNQDGVLTSDKTFDEIHEAAESGKIVVAVYSWGRYILTLTEPDLLFSTSYSADNSNGIIRILRCYDTNDINHMWESAEINLADKTYVDDAVADLENTVNQNDAKITELLSGASTTGGFAAGDDAQVGVGGGAIGKNAQAMYGGGAIGLNATAANGGAVGSGATSLTTGGAVGRNAFAKDAGGAIGHEAKAENGGAVGAGATTGDGFAGGKLALTGTYDTPIDAIQLGTGTNLEEKTLQVYDYKLMDADGTIPDERIPQLGDIESALDNIIVIQNNFLGVGE